MDAVVRPASESDKEPLMSFIKGIWGGHDYIPKVWDEWLNDEHGLMFVAEVNGVPVGMNRVRFQEDGSAWFEGVRVHPSFRGKGLASMLAENSMRVAKERGIGVFRLTSGSRNKAAHRQIARIGFGEESRFSVYEPARGKRPRPTNDAEKAGKKQLPEIRRLIEGSTEFRLGRGVFWHDFTAASLTPQVVTRLVDEGAVWRLGHAVAVTREGGKGSGIWEEVCFIGGHPRDSIKLARSLVGRNTEAEERWVFVPQGSPLVHALRTGGFERSWSMILFERRAANG